MRLSTAPRLGNTYPSMLTMNYGDVLSIFAQTDSGDPLVVDSWYLTYRDMSASSYLGYLNQEVLGNVPPPSGISAAAGLAAMREAHPEWFVTISASNVTYYAPRRSANLPVRAKIVAVSGAGQRELEIDLN